MPNQIEDWLAFTGYSVAVFLTNLQLVALFPPFVRTKLTRPEGYVSDWANISPHKSFAEWNIRKLWLFPPSYPKSGVPMGSEIRIWLQRQ